MCGRYMMTSPVEALRQLFAVQTGLNLGPRYNVAPMQPIPIIRLGGEDELARDEKGRGLTLAQWGLVPHWMKELPSGRPMINARAETVAEKPSFRGAFARHRCLIPANGFYEWQAREAGPKQPFLISLKSTAEEEYPLFAFAGLHEMWTGPGSDNALESATILTTAVNKALAPLHHRMPVILRPDDYAAWLGEADVPARDLLAGLTPFDDADFTFHPVSRQVNSVANDDSALIEEETEDAAKTGAGQKKLILPTE